MFNLGFALLCFCSSVLTPLHSPCLQAFAFRPLLFRFLSLCCKGCVSLGVYLLQSKHQNLLNFSEKIPSYSAVPNSSRQQWVR